MTSGDSSWLAAAGCLALLLCVTASGCSDGGGSNGGGGGTAGNVGVGGMGGTDQCDEAAAQTCLALLDCCRAILVNPVFFQSCNSVALECDQAQCQEILDGYVQCAPEPEP